MPVKSSYLSEIKALAEKAKDKKALYGPDLDLSKYIQHIERGKIESLESLSHQVKEGAILTGMNLKEEHRSGSYLHIDQSVVYESMNKAYEGQLEIMSTSVALDTYDWLAQDKTYYRHSGYVGGLKETSFEKLHARFPTRALEKAVKGMLPKGPLGYAMARKLKVYAGVDHPHSAQQPQSLEIS